MKKRERIMIITDSLSMPRREVGYEETWIFHFKNRFREFDIIDRPARGATSMRLVQEGGGGLDLLELYSPDRVILELGMAECAPRLFKKNGFEHKFINKYLPEKIRNDYIKAIRERRGRKPEFTDVSPEQFRSNIYNFAERCKALNVKLVIMKIMRAPDIFLMKSPYVQQNIDLYNSIYDEAAAAFENITLLSPISGNLDINTLCVDEVHVTAEGQKLYFKAVEDYFKKNK